MTYTNGNPIIFSGNAHPELTVKICNYLKCSPGKIDVFKFSNDNTFVRILENVRERDVFIIQPTVPPVNDHIMEMLIMIDAAKRASAGRITAVIPYYSYARTDKKDQPRVPITARLIADLIGAAGAVRVVLIDLHAAQVQGFFSCPVDELTAMPLIESYFKHKEIPELVVVAADIGISKRARDLASRLNVPLAIVEKRRINNGASVETLNVIGDVENRSVLLLDDEITSGGTMVSAVNAIASYNVRGVYICATHGVFIGDTVQRLSELKGLKEIVVTDTLPLPLGKQSTKVHAISIAKLLGEAINRIHLGKSVGELFKGDARQKTLAMDITL